jgi:hypothetical protein
VIYYRERIWSIITRFFQPNGWRLIVRLIIATIPAVFVGFVCNDLIEGELSKLTLVGKDSAEVYSTWDSIKEAAMNSIVEDKKDVIAESTKSQVLAEKRTKQIQIMSKTIAQLTAQLAETKKLAKEAVQRAETRAGTRLKVKESSINSMKARVQKTIRKLAVVQEDATKFKLAYAFAVKEAAKMGTAYKIAVKEAAKLSKRKKRMNPSTQKKTLRNSSVRQKRRTMQPKWPMPRREKRKHSKHSTRHSPKRG